MIRPSALTAVKADVPEWVAKGMKKQRRRKKSRPEPAPALVPVENLQHQQHQFGLISAEQVLNFERNGHVTVRRLIGQSAIESLHTATQKIIVDGEMEALRHRYESSQYACLSTYLGLARVLVAKHPCTHQDTSHVAVL